MQARSIPNGWRLCDEILDSSLMFIDQAKSAKKPFFVWLNPTRMHVVTHLSPKYEALRNSKNGWSIQEAGMAQVDDIVGSVMKYLKDNGPGRQHDRHVHHRQRHGGLYLAGWRNNPVLRSQRHWL